MVNDKGMGEEILSAVFQWWLTILKQFREDEISESLIPMIVDIHNIWQYKLDIIIF